MHELSIAMSIVEGASREAAIRGGVRVHAVHLKLGPLSGVVKDALMFSFARMRKNVYGSRASIIGMVKEQPAGIVAMQTGFGGTRIVDMLVGEQLPRIC